MWVLLKLERNLLCITGFVVVIQLLNERSPQLLYHLAKLIPLYPFPALGCHCGQFPQNVQISPNDAINARTLDFNGDHFAAVQLAQMHLPDRSSGQRNIVKTNQYVL
ncbi:hypothetical protein D1872_172530 [compost metagenome]